MAWVSEATASELHALGGELREVKAALRTGSSFLGMSGTLLQEYFVELTKKDNLLRVALTRAGSPCCADAGVASVAFSGQPSLPASPAWAAQSGSRPAPLSHGDAAADPVPSRDVGAAGATLREARHPSQPSSFARAECPVAEPACDAGSCKGPPEVRAAVAAAGVQGPLPEASSPMGRALEAPGAAEAYLTQEDAASLAIVLRFLEAHPEDRAAQRVGVHAIGRLARDSAQLRPLCLAAASAISRAATAFPAERSLQRLAMAAMGSLAYDREVAALTAHEVLPAIMAGMTTHAFDARLQDIACEALARLAHAGLTLEHLVMKSLVQTAVGHRDAPALDACSKALARLRSNGIFRPEQILATLLALAESQPSDLDLQKRFALALQAIVRAGGISEDIALPQAAPFLSPQWTQILMRFTGADSEEAGHMGRYHAHIQALFHEEVGKHFEYEAAERCLHLLQRGAPGARLLSEVVRSLVENLEDQQSRLEARQFTWDASEHRLLPLDDVQRQLLREKVFDDMQPGLRNALDAAASAACLPLDRAAAMLECRVSALQGDCAALLERKTEATQAHQEGMEELRREVMLFEVVEYLELQSEQRSPTQVRTALYMLDAAEPRAPQEVIARLRKRLDELATAACLRPPCPPGG